MGVVGQHYGWLDDPGGQHLLHLVHGGGQLLAGLVGQPLVAGGGGQGIVWLVHCGGGLLWGLAILGCSILLDTFSMGVGGSMLDLLASPLVLGDRAWSGLSRVGVGCHCAGWLGLHLILVAWYYTH